MSLLEAGAATAAIDPFAERFCEWMAARAVDGAVAFVAIAAIVLAARRASPHLRGALLLVALVPFVIPLPGPWPRIGVSAPLHRAVGEVLAGASRPPPEASIAPGPGPATRVRPDADGDDGIAPPEPPPAAARRAPWPTIAFLAWSTIALGLLARFVVNGIALRAALRGARRIEDRELGVDGEALARAAGLRRRPRVTVSPEIAAPATVGLMRPAIVLPPALLAALSPKELEFVLLHELSHLRRGDLRLGLIERLVRIAFFFHPAAWLIGRWLARERELSCDDAALALLPAGDRRECAGAFLKIVEHAGAGRPRLAAAAAMSRDGRLVRSRIMRILDPARRFERRMGARSWTVLATAAGLLVCALGSAGGGTVGPGDDPSAIVAQDSSTVSAIRDAADWLLRHQQEQGYWDSDGFGASCPESSCTGKGGMLADPGVTGLAVLALLHARPIAGDARIDAALERGGSYLASIQDTDDGCIGSKSGQHFMYNHAFASVALAELEAVRPDPKRKLAAQKAVDFISRSRNPYKGWRYSYPADGDNDSSVTGSMLIALASALDAGAIIDATAADDGLKLLDELTDATNGRTGYHEMGSLSAREPDDMDTFPADQTEAMTAIALHARAAHDVKIAAAPRTAPGIYLLNAKPPRWNEKSGCIDFYYWYHASAALRAAGGSSWDSWRDAVIRALVPHQRRDGHAAGSFDPGVDPWGDNGGRVYATAINTLSLCLAASEGS